MYSLSLIPLPLSLHKRGASLASLFFLECEILRVKPFRILYVSGSDIVGVKGRERGGETLIKRSKFEPESENGPTREENKFFFSSFRLNWAKL